MLPQHPREQRQGILANHVNESDISISASAALHEHDGVRFEAHCAATVLQLSLQHAIAHGSGNTEDSSSCGSILR